MKRVHRGRTRRRRMIDRRYEKFAQAALGVPLIDAVRMYKAGEIEMGTLARVEIGAYLLMIGDDP